MDFDRIILWLLGGFVVLLTAFAVLMGGSGLARALDGPGPSGKILLGAAIVCLVLLAIDAILLLLAVAVRSVVKPPR